MVDGMVEIIDVGIIFLGIDIIDIGINGFCERCVVVQCYFYFNVFFFVNYMDRCINECCMGFVQVFDKFFQIVF